MTPIPTEGVLPMKLKKPARKYKSGRKPSQKCYSAVETTIASSTEKLPTSDFLQNVFDSLETYGDYHVDGMTSSSMNCSVLNSFMARDTLGITLTLKPPTTIDRAVWLGIRILSAALVIWLITEIACLVLT